MTGNAEYCHWMSVKQRKAALPDSHGGLRHDSH